MARHVAGTFSTVTASEEIILPNDGLGQAAFSLNNGSGSSWSVTLQWKVDGSNWRDCTDEAGDVHTYTDPINCNLNLTPAAKYRLNCTDATNTVAYFLGMPL